MLCATTIMGRLGTPAMNMSFKEMLLEQLGAVVTLLLRRMGAKITTNGCGFLLQGLRLMGCWQGSWRAWLHGQNAPGWGESRDSFIKT